MAKRIKAAAWMSLALTVAFTVAYLLHPHSLLLALAITAGTTGYHLWMRLVVGFAYTLLLHNTVNYRRKWFRVGTTEQRLYTFLRVKKWKKYLPTFDPDAFDRSQHSWQEIAMTMCQSELVHETSVILSFLPILLSLWFGAASVFICTSVAAAMIDVPFAMMQRYNRPRILRILG